MQTQISTTPKTSSLKTQTQTHHTFEQCLMSLTLSSSSSHGLEDYVGIESCLDLKGNDDVSESFAVPRRLIRSEKLARKEFPPPIPLLARTENLSSHMPWVLRRYYTSDGRLVLKEERVKHHEYFRAQRCNGRLTLQLIPLDDEVDNYPPCKEEVKDEDEELEEEEEEEEDDDDEGDTDEEEEEDVAEVKEKHEELAKECEINDYIVNYEDRGQRINNNNKGGINGGIGGSLIGSPCKLLNYSAMIQNSACIFQMPVPTLRPVHT